MSFSMHVDLPGLESFLDGQAVKAEAAARPAAQAAAQVLYDQVQANVDKIGKKSGNLKKSIYQVFSKRASKPGRAVYYISYNPRKAPHGHLLELGHIQRYKVYVGKNGKWYTAVRPGMRGKPKPKRSAPQSAKDAYYVMLPTPVQQPAKAFIRSAAARFNDAAAAGRARFFQEMGAK